MKKKIEVIPDLEIKDEKNWDVFRIWIKKKKVIFDIGIGGAGNCFEVDKDKLKEMLK